MVSDSSSIDVPRLVAGLALSAIGVVFLLARLDLLTVPGRLLDAWPLVIVALGVGALLRAGNHQEQREALWLLGIGAWMLVSTLGLLGLHWDDSWPLILIVAGGIQLIRPKAGSWRVEGLWPLLIGGIFLVSIHGLLGLGFTELWPLLLVLAGGMIIAKALLRAHRGVA